MKLPLKPLLALLVVVLGFSVGMAALLNYFKFDSTLRKLEYARFSLVADDIGNNIELSLGLGLSFGEIGTLQELIERHSRSDTLILSIEVLDGAGRIRYSTRPNRAGQSAPDSWLAMLRRPDWQLAEPDAFIAGRTVRNTFDVVVGGVAVRYDRGPSDAAVAMMGLRLIELAAAITAALVLLGGLMLSVMAKMAERAFAHATSSFSGDDTGVPNTALAAEVRAFCDSANRVEREIGVTLALIQPDVTRNQT